MTSSSTAQKSAIAKTMTGSLQSLRLGALPLGQLGQAVNWSNSTAYQAPTVSPWVELPVSDASAVTSPEPESTAPVSIAEPVSIPVVSAESERLAAEQQDRARIEAEQIENAKIEGAKVEALKRQEEERLAAEREQRKQDEAKKLEQQKLEEQRLQQEKLEQEKLEQQKLERAKLEAQASEQQRLDQDKREKQEQESREEQRLETEKLEQQKVEQQKLEQQKIEQQKVEQQKLEQQKLEQQRLERERLEAAEREAQRLRDEQHKATASAQATRPVREAENDLGTRRASEAKPRISSPANKPKVTRSTSLMEASRPSELSESPEAYLAKLERLVLELNMELSRRSDGQVPVDPIEQLTQRIIELNLENMELREQLEQSKSPRN